MKPIRVVFKVKIDNPDYRYGDLHQASSLEVKDTGFLVSFTATGSHGIVIADSGGAFYCVPLSGLKEAA